MEASLSACVMLLKKDFAGFCGKELTAMGLAPGLLYFVIYLGKHPGCSPGQLAAQLGADTGHTARSVEKLVQAGFVQRRKNPMDQRGFQLRLTPKGEEAFDKIRGLFARWDGMAMEELGPEERKLLLELLGRVVNRRRKETAT